MMPLSLAKIGEENIVARVRGNSEVKRHLNNLGIVEGGRIEVVSEMAGNLILCILDSRVAISKEMAQRIDVETSVGRNGFHDRNYGRERNRWRRGR